MSRAKKDGQYLNCYIDRDLRERLVSYAEQKGQTVTMPLERILKQFLDAADARNPMSVFSYVDDSILYYDFPESD